MSWNSPVDNRFHPSSVDPWCMGRVDPAAILICMSTVMRSGGGEGLKRERLRRMPSTSSDVGIPFAKIHSSAEPLRGFCYCSLRVGELERWRWLGTPSECQTELSEAGNQGPKRPRSKVKSKIQMRQNRLPNRFGKPNSRLLAVGCQGLEGWSVKDL